MFPFLITVMLGMGLAINPNVIKNDSLIFENPIKLEITGEYISVAFTNDGENLIMSKPKFQGIYVYNIRNKKLKTISDDFGAGYKYSVRYDNGAITYKSNNSNKYSLYLYDMRNDKRIELKPPLNLIGQPFFTRANDIIVNYGGETQIISQTGKLIKSLPNVSSNLIIVTSDDKYIIYSDLSDRLWSYNISNGRKSQLTPDGERYFNSIPSLTSNKIVCNQLGGMITVIDIPSGKKKQIDYGDYFYFNPSGKEIFYTKTTDNGENITSGEIYHSSVNNPNPIHIELSDGIKLASAFHPKWGLVFLDNAGNVYLAKTKNEVKE